MRTFKLAVSFLTVFPIRLATAPQPGDLGRAASWYPLVGLLVGLCLAAARLFFGMMFPDPLGAILVVVLWAALTGGLHLDGLADCCDGLLAAVPRERRLEIMRDPRLGSFGGVGLALFLLLKTGAVMAIPPDHPAPAVILPLLFAPSLARWLILLAARAPMARPGGLGAEFALGVTWQTYLNAAIVPLCLLAFGGLQALLAVALAHVFALGAIRLARARLGGLTGDVLGLIVELGELGVLLAFAARL